MTGKLTPEEVVESVLGKVSGSADVRFYHDRWTTLRLANSHLYQPHLEELRSLSLRVAREGGRIGVATTTDLSMEGIERLVRTASSLAERAPPMPSFQGFPGPTSSPERPVPCSEEVLAGGPVSKGFEVAEALRLTREIKAPRVAGVYNEGACEMQVANTSGRWTRSRRSVSQASFLVEDLSHDPPVSGWSEAAHWDPRQVNLVSLAREALDRTPRTRVSSVEAGSYRVLFRPPAVATMMSMLAMGGLGAYAVEEGWSFLKAPPAERDVHPSINLHDDPLSPLGLPMAIDYDGTPHYPRPVFLAGKAQGAANDIITGSRGGGASTGNALPPEPPYGREGPLPLNLRMDPGGASEAEMLREMNQGIVVTRLHYVRFVNRQKTVITGMTRDGTYRVERGSVEAPVANLRLTDGILTMLGKTLLVGKDLRCCNEDERGVFSAVVPSLLVDGVHFSSSTTF